MLLPISRAARAPLAVLATALVTLTVAACADDRGVTAPPTRPTPGVAAHDLATLTSDSTLITFGAAREGQIYSNGDVHVSATITCSRDLGESYTMVATLQQDQRTTDVISSLRYGRTCPPQGEPFQFFFHPPTVGSSFKRGKAVVTFQVVDGAPSVIRSTTSQAVKLAQLK